MEILKAVILGLVQGLSEFLPISSSGHLVIFQEILNFHHEGIAFEVFVHFGTLLSVLLAFRKEIGQMIMAPYKVWVQKSTDASDIESLKWDYYIIVASIPAGVIGLTLKDIIETAFTNILLVFTFLFVTAIIMWVTQYLKPKENLKFNYLNTFIIGVAQAFAILPGISRSGSTIFTGMAQGLDKERVAKFSFIMSIPPIFGATLLQLKDMMETPPASSELMGLIIGAIVAFISGYGAIIWLLDLVRKGKLQYFGIYCFIVSIAGIIWYFAG